MVDGFQELPPKPQLAITHAFYGQISRRLAAFRARFSEAHDIGAAAQHHSPLPPRHAFTRAAYHATRYRHRISMLIRLQFLSIGTLR